MSEIVTWYLQMDMDTQREFIDDHLHGGCEEIAVVQAATWKDARAELVPL